MYSHQHIPHLSLLSLSNTHTRCQGCIAVAGYCFCLESIFGFLSWERIKNAGRGKWWVQGCPYALETKITREQVRTSPHHHRFHRPRKLWNMYPWSSCTMCSPLDRDVTGRVSFLAKLLPFYAISWISSKNRSRSWMPHYHWFKKIGTAKFPRRWIGHRYKLCRSVPRRTLSSENPSHLTKKKEMDRSIPSQ